jgi:predicted nuclease of restriction endonuclease-like (RecB) superfamily
MAKKTARIAKIDAVRLLHLDTQYQHLLNEIKSRLKKSQLRAAIAVNHELIAFYWEIGKLLIERQEKAKWGEKLFEALAKDLRRNFPNTEGFSKTNLKNMRLFAKHYPTGEFGQALPDQLTWTHHIVLIQMLEPEKISVKQWRGDFHPKDAGQLNFYLSAINEHLKMPEDGQTIGLLLCEKKDRVIAEYALRRIDSPMGISEYELSKSLPERLHNILPTIDEIETELSEFAKEIIPTLNKEKDSEK